MSKYARKGFIGWKPINDRLITVRLNTSYWTLSVIQWYAHKHDDNDNFYNTRILSIQEVPKHDVMIVIGDLNAKVGKDNAWFEKITGKEADNDNGKRLLELCVTNYLVISGSLFKHKDIRIRCNY